MTEPNAEMARSRPDLLGALGRAVDAARASTFVCGHPWSGRGPHCVNSTCVHHWSNCVNHAEHLTGPGDPS